MEIKSVTIEHPKTATKLSRFIKKSKIINEQPEKTKVYKGSNAADHTLKLDIIKRTIFPKKCSKHYEIKI